MVPAAALSASPEVPVKSFARRLRAALPVVVTEHVIWRQWRVCVSGISSLVTGRELPANSAATASEGPAAQHPALRSMDSHVGAMVHAELRMGSARALLDTAEVPVHQHHARSRHVSFLRCLVQTALCSAPVHQCHCILHATAMDRAATAPLGRDDVTATSDTVAAIAVCCAQ